MIKNKLYQTLYLDFIKHESACYIDTNSKVTVYLKLSEFEGNPPQMITIKLGDQ